MIILEDVLSVSSDVPDVVCFFSLFVLSLSLFRSLSLFHILPTARR